MSELSTDLRRTTENQKEQKAKVSFSPFSGDSSSRCVVVARIKDTPAKCFAANEDIYPGDHVIILAIGIGGKLDKFVK